MDPNVNKWDQPFVLGVVDPHDSLSHPAGVSDVQAESATCLDPDLFTDFLVWKYVIYLDDCSLNKDKLMNSMKIFGCFAEQISVLNLLVYVNLLYLMRPH